MDGKDMHTRAGSKLVTVISLLAALLILAAVVFLLVTRPEKKEADPHEGQVYINDGFGMVWITPHENVPVSTLREEDISFSGRWPAYVGTEYDVRYGVDVSEHQWDIDWSLVKSAGVDFAFVRLGYRGFTEGGLFTDPYFDRNVTSARKNNIDVGVYFFSQALSVQEAIEEAQYVIDALKYYDINMPVVFDWEKIEGNTVVRTDGMDSTILTDCAVAFCQTLENAGYDACVYFNRHFGYYEFDLSRLTNYQFWVALPDAFPDFYYKFDFWQYSFSCEVPGIEGPADMNMQFIPRETGDAQNAPSSTAQSK